MSKQSVLHCEVNTLREVPMALFTLDFNVLGVVKKGLLAVQEAEV